MDVSSAFFSVWIYGLTGFAVYAFVQLFAAPIYAFSRLPASWFVQFGIWGLFFSLCTLITGRPVCSASAGLAMIVVLVLVNKAKYKSLREPFLFQDYDYFLDTIRFPRLFLPFMGLKSFCAAAFFCGLSIWGFICEQPPEARWTLSGQAGAALLFLAISGLSLWLGAKFLPQPLADPEKDLKKYGFVTFLYLYGIHNRKREHSLSPFSSLPAFRPVKMPHLVAIQSESFFDARQLFAGIRRDLLPALDRFSSESLLHGSLDVPAWGANTSRTECAFLTGIPPADLGIHRFSPYQKMVSGWNPGGLPAFLRSLGYKTVCIHPYYGNFYGRDKIFSRLGFEKFLDYRAFADCDKPGQYVGDVDLGKKILETFDESKDPVFIFAITMENHGPLGLEKMPSADKLDKFFDILPPPGCHDLDVYLNHLVNADKMLAMFREAWENSGSVSLCFYGDHVPIMPACYELLGYPCGKVPYFCWSSQNRGRHIPRHIKNIAAQDLAASWLNAVGIISPGSKPF